MRRRLGLIVALCALSGPSSASVVEQSADRAVRAEACGSLLVPLCTSPADIESSSFGLFDATQNAMDSSAGVASGLSGQESTIGSGSYTGTLSTLATADASPSPGFQISDGFAQSEFNITFTLDGPTEFEVSATGFLSEGSSGFTSGRAQIVLTQTPLGVPAFELVVTTPQVFDESATVTLGAGTYLLFVEAEASAQAQGTSLTETEAMITFAVTTSPSGPLFRRGDANGDETFDISDAVYTLAALFIPGAPSPGCASAADVNDDGTLDISDAVYALGGLFIAGAPLPPDPGPAVCGLDPTPDALTCDTSPCP